MQVTVRFLHKQTDYSSAIPFVLYLVTNVQRERE